MEDVVLAITRHRVEVTQENLKMARTSLYQVRLQWEGGESSTSKAIIKHLTSIRGEIEAIEHQMDELSERIARGADE